jgi:hypothetical protein
MATSNHLTAEVGRNGSMNQTVAARMSQLPTQLERAVSGCVAARLGGCATTQLHG